MTTPAPSDSGTNQRTKTILLSVAAIFLIGIGALIVTRNVSHYQPNPLPQELPEATGDNGIPVNPREHIMKIMSELELSTSQWLQLARLGRPSGDRAAREEHAQKIAEVLNDKQLEKFTAEMREIHYAITRHVMSKLSPADQEAFVKRLEKHPEFAPGPPMPLLDPNYKENAK